MNDNDKTFGPRAGLLEIIESFAPGYHAALALFTTTQREILVLKLVIIGALVTAGSFVVVHAKNFDSTTAMAAYVTVVLSIGLGRILRLEDQLEGLVAQRR